MVGMAKQHDEAMADMTAKTAAATEACDQLEEARHRASQAESSAEKALQVLCPPLADQAGGGMWPSPGLMTSSSSGICSLSIRQSSQCRQMIHTRSMPDSPLLKPPEFNSDSTPATAVDQTLVDEMREYPTRSANIAASLCSPATLHTFLHFPCVLAAPLLAGLPWAMPLLLLA